MSLDQAITAAVSTYLASFGKGDLEAIIDLYAEDCWIEDPVGAERLSGKEALRAFYQTAIDMGAKGTLESEIRIAGNQAAFAFNMEIETPDGTFSTRPIDVMTFDDQGKILNMRAFWGPANQSVG